MLQRQLSAAFQTGYAGSIPVARSGLDLLGGVVAVVSLVGPRLCMAGPSASSGRSSPGRRCAQSARAGLHRVSELQQCCPVQFAAAQPYQLGRGCPVQFGFEQPYQTQLRDTAPSPN